MRTREIKSLLLKKGWAGRTISRKATIARVNPLLEQHVALGRMYDQADPLTADPADLRELEAIRRIVRLDAGKLAETVFSCGGVAYASADRSTSVLAGASLLAQLTEKERALHQALLQEQMIEHQMRTEAVLQRCIQSSTERLSFLNKCARRLWTAQ